MITVWTIESTINHLLAEAKKVEENRGDLPKYGFSEYEMFLFDQIVPRLEGIVHTIGDFENLRDAILNSEEQRKKND